MSFNLQIIPYTSRFLLNASSFPNSPINIEESSSRSQTPPVASSHTHDVLDIAMECINKTQADITLNRVLNGLLLNKLFVINSKKIQDPSQSSEEESKLQDKIERCRGHWQGELSLQLEKIKNQVEAVKVTPSALEMRVLKEQVEKLNLSNSQLEKETTLLKLELLSYDNEVTYDLLNQQLDKILHGFALDEKLINQLGNRYLKSVLTFLTHTKKMGSSLDKEAISDHLSRLNKNLTQLKINQEKLIVSIKEEISVVTSDAKTKAEMICNTFYKENQEIKNKIDGLNKNRDALIQTNGPWALVSALKLEPQKKAYLDEFKRRLLIGAEVSEDADIDSFIAFFGKALEKMEIIFRKDVVDIFHNFPKTGELIFTLNNVQMVYLEMYEVQTEAIDIKRKIAKLKDLLKPEEVYHDARRTLQKLYTQPFHFTPFEYPHRIELMGYLSNSVEVTTHVLMELEKIARSF